MLQQIMQNPAEFFGMVLAVIVAFNLALGGIKQGLEYIAAKTATKLDDEALAIVNKVIDVLKKIIDVIGYNQKH